jgi:hypothetical protein
MDLHTDRARQAPARVPNESPGKVTELEIAYGMRVEADNRPAIVFASAARTPRMRVLGTCRLDLDITELTLAGATMRSPDTDTGRRHALRNQCAQPDGKRKRSGMCDTEFWE